MMTDEEYMREALRLAGLGRGYTSPNPMVGALVVRDGEIVGAGWHRRAGTEHAEILALAMAGELARGATMYVTLEPCSHTGRTGPCAKAVAAAGVKRVVSAMEDPNPLVVGKGYDMLRRAGIEVSSGLLESEARRLNEVFLKWITRRRPFVTLKMAMTLDGKIATATGESKWITCEASRSRAHELRRINDAVLVGVGTVLADDPALTVRLPGFSGQNPTRVVLDSSARTPLTAKIINDHAAKTIIATAADAPEERLDALRRRGAVILTTGTRGAVNLPELMEKLGANDITSVLVEGGGEVHFSMLCEKLADKIAAFVAPKFFGGRDSKGAIGGRGFDSIVSAPRLVDMKTEKIGEDILFTGYIADPED